MASLPLIDTLSADGNSETFRADGSYDTVVFLIGDFGGGTAKIQASPDNGTTFVDLANSSFTAAGVKNIILPRETILRVNLAGATSPDLDIHVDYIRG